MRKKTVRCTVFADVGNERKRGDRRVAPENPFQRAKTKILSILIDGIFVLYYSLFIIQYSSFI